MLPPTVLMTYVKAVPFRPFRLHMASGRTFDVRHPEMIRVGKSNVHLYKFVGEETEIFDEWDYISLMLLESISHIDSPISADKMSH